MWCWNRWLVLAAAMLLVLSSGWLPQRKPARSVATPGVTKSAILIGWLAG